MKNGTFLTVDSGGSKTKFGLYTTADNLIKEGVCQGFGTATDSDNVLPALAEALQSFCDGYAPEVVVCNLGGKNKTEFLNTLKQAFKSAKIQLFRESEGEIGRALCKLYHAQVTLMAGTGAIAIAPVGKDTIISGGWGANISDMGSGYQLGLDAVRNALKEVDGTQEFSLLTKTLLCETHPPKLLTAQEYCAYRDKVRGKLAPFARSHIASYAKTVYACAKQGDKVSIALYEKAGEDLADTVLSAAAKTGNPLINAVVTGGMVNAKEFWQDSFENRLKQAQNFNQVFYIADGIDVGMRAIATNKTKE